MPQRLTFTNGPPVLHCIMQKLLMISSMILGRTNVKIPIRIGRKDATTEEEAGPIDSIPDATKGAKAFLDAYYEKGFSGRDLVALEALNAYGSVNETTSSSNWRENPQFNNYYYKHLLDGSHNAPLPQDKILLSVKSMLTI